MEIRTCCDICGIWPTYHGLKPTALKSACFELPSRSPPLSPRKPLRCGIINSNDRDNKLICHHHHHDRHGRHRHRQNHFRGHGVARTATFALKTTSSQECLSIMPRKSVSQHGLTRVFQDCATRVSVLQECAARVSHANGSQKFCSRVSCMRGRGHFQQHVLSFTYYLHLWWILLIFEMWFCPSKFAPGLWWNHLASWRSKKHRGLPGSAESAFRRHAEVLPRYMFSLAFYVFFDMHMYVYIYTHIFVCKYIYI